MAEDGHGEAATAQATAWHVGLLGQPREYDHLQLHVRVLRHVYNIEMHAQLLVLMAEI